MLHEHDRHERASRDLWYRLTYETEKENQRRDAERWSRVEKSAKANKSAAQGGQGVNWSGLARIGLILMAVGYIFDVVDNNMLRFTLIGVSAFVIYRYIKAVLLLLVAAFVGARYFGIPL